MIKTFCDCHEDGIDKQITYYDPYLDQYICEETAVKMIKHYQYLLENIQKDKKRDPW